MFSIFSQSYQSYLDYINSHYPNAIAYLSGNRNNPNIDGRVEFYQTCDGVLVLTQVKNLPQNETGNFFAMHIHSGDSCELTDGEFMNTPHLNLTNKNHPSHTGDLPVILSNDGSAFSLNLTNRFTINDIIDKTVIIHENADDYRLDPSGNSGTKIACGKILKRC